MCAALGVCCTWVRVGQTFAMVVVKKNETGLGKTVVPLACGYKCQSPRRGARVPIYFGC